MAKNHKFAQDCATSSKQFKTYTESNIVKIHVYHGKFRLHFDEMMISALHLTNTLSWIFIVLAH